MGDVTRFVPKAELERARLIREARAIYDSIFPPCDRLADETQHTRSEQMQGDASRSPPVA
jgi:hypothetical protein